MSTRLEGMNPSKHRDYRRKVAREAALLLYSSQEKEYRQAKIKAANNLGVRFYPSNREVAEELDKLIEEMEGPSRWDRLIKMRSEALEIMRCLADLDPILVGSVWRGTANKNSDIDITVFTSEPKLVKKRLKDNGYTISREEQVTTVKRGLKKSSYHIYVALPSSREVEVSVRQPESKDERLICEIYGDVVKGLDTPHLEILMKTEPTRRFLPNS